MNDSTRWPEADWLPKRLKPIVLKINLEKYGTFYQFLVSNLYSFCDKKHGFVMDGATMFAASDSSCNGKKRLWPGSSIANATNDDKLHDSIRIKTERKAAEYYAR